MVFFPWKDEYSVGIKKFDEQHKNLVGFLNELYEAMNNGRGKDILGKVLSNLVQSSPPFVVLKIEPLNPTVQPILLFKKKISSKP